MEGVLRIERYFMIFLKLLVQSMAFRVLHMKCFVVH